MYYPNHQEREAEEIVFQVREEATGQGLCVFLVVPAEDICFILLKIRF